MFGTFEIVLHIITFVLSLVLMGLTFAAVFNISPYELCEDIIIIIKARRRRIRQNEGGEEEALNSLVETDERLSRALQHLSYLADFPFVILRMLQI